MKQLSVVQADWLDGQVPPMGPDSALLSVSSIINSLFQLGGVPVTYTSNAAANTADTVTHNLGRVPAGYIAILNGNGGVVYNGGGASNATTISLKCTTAANAVTLLVF